jgi:poly-gamma-glutamate capsule biosynthesis protein CapA/YwtB (metallophosphatase superfamily)
VKLALAGDTMLGRKVAEAMQSRPPQSLVAPEIADAANEADLFVLNLECCISDRGGRWPTLGKPFFFRAPPQAVELLTHLGVDCVTLANNHALDYGEEALLDTLDLLDAAGIAHVGAGADVEGARTPAVLAHDGFRLGVVGFSDHPADFAAHERPGIAYVDLRDGLPAWVGETIARLDTDSVLVSPHWGPNMAPAPLPFVRTAAQELVDAGATLVAGHSAHVFQGIEGHVLYDLGDFLDDYAVDELLRNDLGLFFLVTFDAQAPTRLEALPLKLDYCYTRVATGSEAAWIARRFREACAAFGTAVEEEDGRLVVDWRI